MNLKKIFVGDLKTCGVYIGDIKICTQFESAKELDELKHSADVLGDYKYQSDIYKKNAILVKFKNGAFVDAYDVHDLIDICSILTTVDNKGFYLNGILLDVRATGVGRKFVDEKSLKPYKKKTTSVKLNIAVKVLNKKKK